MELFTQFGLAGLVLGILAFVVKYFVQAMKDKDGYNRELVQQLAALTKQQVEVQSKLTRSIDANTQATKTSSDNITKLTVEVMKSK